MLQTVGGSMSLTFRFWLLCLTLLLTTLVTAETFFPFRGDQGDLPDFQPHSAHWIGEDKLLLGDIHLNNLQVFDTKGRRFRLFEAATNKGPAEFVGLTQLDSSDFLIVGSHHHKKNHPRYRKLRSRLHRFSLNVEKEELNLEDFKNNISPLEALRRTRMWGSSPKRPLKFAGMSANKAKDLVWFGLAQPLSEKGNLSLLRCSLSKLLAQDEDLEFTEVDTGLPVPVEKRCQKEMYLTGIQVLDDGSLLLLLTADVLEGGRLCTNALYRWVPGGKATLVKDDLGSEKRATAMAVKSLGKGTYKLALICDNATSETEIPSGLLLFSSPLKIH